MNPGEKLNTILGHTIVVGEQFGEGGQGTISHATVVGRHTERFIVKAFSDEFNREASQKRNNFLMDKRFHTLCPMFHTPVDLIVHPKYVGYIAPFAPGEPLDDFLTHNAHTVTQALIVALAIAHAVNIMHKHGVAHGDIKPANILLNWRGSVIEVHFIDCDNFRAHGAPLPLCYGDLPFVAPEIQAGIEAGKPYYPDIETDRFALGVTIHVVLLLFHPAAGYDDKHHTYKRALWEGAWLYNSYRGGHAKFKKCRPTAFLNGHVTNLIARAMSLKRADRPSAEEWCRCLLRALRENTPCPECGRAMLFDPGRQVCPYDEHPFPTFKVVCPNGRRIAIDSGHVVLGRNVLGSPYVSEVHAIFRKQGAATFVEIHGRHGAWRFVAGTWKALPQGTPVLLDKRDRLRLADIEVTIE